MVCLLLTTFGGAAAAQKAAPVAALRQAADDPADEAAADALRREFLEKVSPAEWQCYLDAKQDRAALWRGFTKAYAVAAMMASDTPFPSEAFVPTCAVAAKAKSSAGSVARAAGTAFLNGLKQYLRGAVRTPRPAAVDAAENAVFGRRASASTDLPSYDEPRVEKAAAMITIMQGEDAAKAFMSSPPMAQARAITTAAIASTESRAWPSAWMVGLADTNFWWMLNNKRGADHPDTVGYLAMNQRHRGEAIRRYYLFLWQQALDTIDGKRSGDELAALWRTPAFRSSAMVEAAFGPDVAARYARAAETPDADPTFKREEIETAALILVSVVPNLAALLL